MEKIDLTKKNKLSYYELLSKGLEKLQINCDKKMLLEKLCLYIEEIKMFDKAFNLVNYKDDDDLVISHILDSLSAWKFFDNEINNFYSTTAIEKNVIDENFKIADIGSGAGLPGIPLASLFLLKENIFPTLEFYLVERMAKRCAFLNNQKALLGLKNTEVIESELGNIEENKFSLVTCRAFRTLDKKILFSLLNCVKPKGSLFLYKATNEKINEDVKMIESQNLGYKIEKIFVPFLNKTRNLLIIKKISY